MKEILFTLIRSGLYGTQLSDSDVPEKLDWELLMGFVQKQTITGVVADAVMRLPKTVQVPKEIKQKLMEGNYSGPLCS